MGRQISEEKQRQVIALDAEGMCCRAVARRLGISQSIAAAIAKRGTVKPVRRPNDPSPKDIAKQAAYFQAWNLLAMEGKRSTNQPHDGKAAVHIAGNAIVFEGDECDDNKLKRY